MSETPRKSGSMVFRWSCLAAAVLFGVVLLYLVWDLKHDVTASLDQARQAVGEANAAITVVNEKLPEIVGEVKKGTETLSNVADDVELIKSVAGIRSEQDRGVRSLAVYANDIQQVLADQTEGREAVIMIEEILGSDLKRVETIEEFLVGLNKEMVLAILPLSKSKQEILFRTCHSNPPRRKPFYVRFGDGDPEKLEDFIRRHHPESAELPQLEGR